MLSSSLSSQSDVDGFVMTAKRRDVVAAAAAGRAINAPLKFTTESAEHIISRLFHLMATPPQPVVLFISGSSSEYAATLRVFDHIRLSCLPVIGVAVTTLGTLQTALLQACTVRLAFSDSWFELQLLGDWLDASVTLSPGLAASEVRDSLLREVARKRARLTAVADILASRTIRPAADWESVMLSAGGVPLDDALRIGLIDGIID